MTPRPMIFISHSSHDRRDSELAHGIARGLRLRGARVWIAPESIPAGDEWESAIASALLEQCTHVLVLLSAASARAPWVMHEIELALDRRRRANDLAILPLHLGEPGDYPHRDELGRFQSVPFVNDLDAQVAILAQALELPPGIPARYRALIEDKTESFVGRQGVFAALEDFCTRNDRGYLAIEGEPGAGKSAVIAELARRRQCIVHFNERSQNVTTAKQFLDSVCDQLITRYGLGGDGHPPPGSHDAHRLSELLDQASRKASESVLVLVDALDEADLAGTALGANVLWLPSTLPANVYLVVSYRRRGGLPLVIHAPFARIDLTGDADAADRDTRAFVINAAQRPGVAAWLAREQLSDDELVALLVPKSAGNFMYLRYVMADLEAGRYSGKDLSRLPERLEGYYEDHWRRMGMTADPLPRMRLRILYVVCELRRPASRALISRLVGDADGSDQVGVQSVLDEWEAFLRRALNDNQATYSVYHSSFREFLHRKDILQAAGLTIAGINDHIADALWNDLFDEPD